MENISEVYKLPATIRVYNQYPYKRQQEATVLYVEDNQVVFDKTIFYAESGGQIFDTGSVDGLQVTNVQKRLGELHLVKNKNIDVPAVRVNTRIIHTFATPVPFTPGMKVTMMIDWPRRYNIMKNHTLSHFLFHAISDFFSQNNLDMFLKGCTINEEKSSFSLNNSLDENDMKHIQQTVTSLFQKGIDIVMEAEPTNNEVYYWRYQDIVIPCGGTHILNTDEINDFQTGKKSGGRNKTRIWIKHLP